MKVSLPATSPWAPAVASVIFLACTRYFSDLAFAAYHYTKVARHYSYQPALQAELVSGLDSLAHDLMRSNLGRVVALVFALWALCGRPRWPGFVALGLWLADATVDVLNGIS